MRDRNHVLLDIGQSVPEPVGPLVERLKHVPHAPGVYVWKDSSGTVIYVGKSKQLRERMRSYFGAPHTLTPKTRWLVSQIADFEIILTASELDALLLEITLIKRYRPKYNILLKDDKSYPYLKITLHEPWPRITIIRKTSDDAARYFGPYSSAVGLRRWLKQLNHVFGFRPPFDCPDDKFERHRQLDRPCLYYELQRCVGPCSTVISQAEYHQLIQSVVHFLEGKTEQVFQQLRTAMNYASDHLAFEQAAYLRDQLRAVERLTEQQHVYQSDHDDQDVVVTIRENEVSVVDVLHVRAGKLVGSQPFVLQNVEGEADSEIVSAFLVQFYARAAYVPPHILLGQAIDDVETVAQWLASRRGAPVSLTVAQPTESHPLISLALENAQQKLREVRLQQGGSRAWAADGLRELRDLLGLDRPPERIECYDVSNTQGDHSVGALVVFEHGLPLKRRYRSFKIKSVAGIDDGASIREVVLRRFRRATEAGSADEPAHLGWRELPDLLLIDGGSAQLDGACAALRELGLDSLPAVGVVKGPQRDRFDLLVPGASQLIVLDRRSAALRLVQTIDEEADRVAKRHHRALRNKAAIASPLDSIPGVGRQRRQLLLTTFGSLEQIRAASVEELAALPGMTRTIALAVKQRL